MTDYNIDFKDHVVQHPNRFRQVQVSPGVVDLIPTWVENPAQVIEQGTPVNAELFDKLRANVTRRSETFTATAGQTVFNLTQAYLVNQGRIDVYISGVKQRTGVDFTETNPTRFTLSEGLEAGTIIEAVYFSASQALSEDLIEQVQAAEAATLAANDAADDANDAAIATLTANLNWKEPVNNLTALNALASPQTRDTRQTKDTGNVYRYDGATWVLIQTMDPNAINALDTRVTSQLADIVLNVKLFGAKGDGTTNDTAAFQNAVDSLPSVGGKILVPKGVYIVNYLQTGVKNIVIEGLGRGVSIIKRSQNVRVIQSVGNGLNALEIRNVTIDGAGFRSIGVRSGNVKRISIIDSEVSNCGQFTVAEGQERGSIDAVFCVNVEYGVFVRSSFNNNERDGILGYPVKHMTVRDCTFERNGRFPAANQQDDQLINYPLSAKFINNYAFECGAGGFDAETHTSFPPVYALYDGNQIIDCGNDDDVGYSWGIIMGINSFGEILNNYISGLGKDSTNPQYRSGIACSGNKGTIVIRGNRVVNSGRHGIFVETPNNEVIVDGNTLIGNDECGIFAYNAPRVRIMNNIVKNNKHHGIKLNLSSRALVSGNVVRDNSQAGSGLYSAIRSELSFELTVTQNTVTGVLHNYCFDLDDEPYVATLNLSMNQFKDAVTRWFTFAGSSSHGNVFNGVKNYYAPFNAPPGSGTWRRGDIIYNTSPLAAGYIGFVCTAGGTPGTWKGFGAIQA